jgi:hypothetical protein
MRGLAEQADQQVRLDAGAMLKVDAADLPDAAALTRAFSGPRAEHWTGVRVRRDEPARHLDLWLLTMLGRGKGAGASFSRLSVTPDARESDSPIPPCPG